MHNIKILECILCCNNFSKNNMVVPEKKMKIVEGKILEVLSYDIKTQILKVKVILKNLCDKHIFCKKCLPKCEGKCPICRRTFTKIISLSDSKESTTTALLKIKNITDRQFKQIDEYKFKDKEQFKLEYLSYILPKKIKKLLKEKKFKEAFLQIKNLKTGELKESLILDIYSKVSKVEYNDPKIFLALEISEALIDEISDNSKKSYAIKELYIHYISLEKFEKAEKIASKSILPWNRDSLYEWFLEWHGLLLFIGTGSWKLLKPYKCFEALEEMSSSNKLKELETVLKNISKDYKYRNALLSVLSLIYKDRGQNKKGKEIENLIDKKIIKYSKKFKKYQESAFNDYKKYKQLLYLINTPNKIINKNKFEKIFNLVNTIKDLKLKKKCFWEILEDILPSSITDTETDEIMLIADAFKDFNNNLIHFKDPLSNFDYCLQFIKKILKKMMKISNSEEKELLMLYKKNCMITFYTFCLAYKKNQMLEKEKEKKLESLIDKDLKKKVDKLFKQYEEELKKNSFF